MYPGGTIVPGPVDGGPTPAQVGAGAWLGAGGARSPPAGTALVGVLGGTGGSIAGAVTGSMATAGGSGAWNANWSCLICCGSTTFALSLVTGACLGRMTPRKTVAGCHRPAVPFSNGSSSDAVVGYH